MILALILFLQGGLFYIRQNQLSQVQVERMEREKTLHEGTRLAFDIEQFLQSGQENIISSLLSFEMSDESMTGAVLYDDRGAKMMSVGQLPDMEAEGGSLQRMLRSVRTHRAAKSELSADGYALRAVFPVQLNRAPGQLRPNMFGALLLEKNLSPRKNLAKAEAFGEFILVTGLTSVVIVALWGAFALFLSSRIRRLRKASEGLAIGDYSVRVAMEGHGELYEVGKAFDTMAGMIQKRDGDLKQSQERYEFLSNASQEGIIVHIDGVVQDANRRAAEIFGYDFAEFIGRNILDLATPEARTVIEEHCKSESRQTYEVEFLKANGQRFVGEKTGAPIEYMGKAARLVIIQDTTEKKKIREDLELYRLMIEKTSDPVFLIDSLTGRMVYVNEAAVRHFGAPREEILKWSIPDWDPNFRKEDLETHVEKIRKNPGMVLQTTHRVKSGEIVPVEISLNLTEYKGRPCHFGYFKNVKEKRLQEESLKNSEALLTTAQRIANVGSWEWDIPSGQLMWSEEMYHILGLTPDGATASFELLLRHVHQEDKESVRVAMEGAFTSGAPFQVDHRIVLASGQVRNVEDQGEVFRGMDGAPVRVVGTLHDITERIQVEEMLNQTLVVSEQLRQEAEMASRAKSDFLANMSHELRTPLNGIIGISDILADSNLAHVQRKQVELIRSSGDALLTLVNDILDLARIESGHFELEQVPFDLVDLVESTSELYAVQAQGKGLELVASLDEKTPARLIGDPDRLRQVLVNLIGNAIKFTNKGEIQVGVFCESVTKDKAMLRFFVRDTGIGIPEEKLEAIFQRFTQVDESSTRQYGGVGLGAAISREFVTMMGGKIWAESELGKGSRLNFTAEFDLDKSGMRTIPASLDTLKGALALIVDDNETNRIALTKTLESWGMKPETAQSGPEMLAYIKALPEEAPLPQLILIDFKMPDMDGIEAFRRMREECPRAVDVKAILLSSITADLGGRVSGTGISATITKPVRRADLLEHVLNIFGGHGPLWGSQRANMGARQDRSDLTVLLAEDNEVNREVARYALSREGYSIVYASNGQEAVERYTEGGIDLILMDVQMPMMDGLRATVEIRRLERERGIARVPIIAMTARAMEQDRVDCLAVGMDDYAGKPLKLDILHDKIAKALGLQSPITPLAPDDVSDAESGVALYNISEVNRMVSGDKANLATFLRLMIKSSRISLDGLEMAAGKGAQEEVRRLAHNIKGSASQIGAWKLTKLAGELEDSAGFGGFSSDAEKVTLLRAAFDELQGELEEEIKRLGL